MIEIGGGSRWRRRALAPTTDFSLTTMPNAIPIRVRSGSRMACTGCRASTIKRILPGPMRGFQAPPLASGILYELHIGTFTPEGTFDAAADKLEYLVELGVTHVELMPVAAFEGRHGWGYDGVALYAVHEPYGGPDGLKRFVNAAHGKGLAVLLDVVYNHFGPSGNYTGKFGPYVVDSHHTPWGGAVNLEDADSYEVRRFFCDNALMWLRDFHIDGLRIDAVHAFVDRSAIHFLEQLAAEVEALRGIDCAPPDADRRERFE